MVYFFQAGGIKPYWEEQNSNERLYVTNGKAQKVSSKNFFQKPWIFQDTYSSVSALKKNKIKNSHVWKMSWPDITLQVIYTVMTKI